MDWPFLLNVFIACFQVLNYNTMATNGTTMAPIATHDTARTATVPGQPEPIVHEKRGMFGRKQHAKGTAAPAEGMRGPDGPYGHKFKFGQWIK